MQPRTVFEAFEQGRFFGGEGKKDFAALPWNDHPAFAGVSLKHLLTGKDTDGRFSYHLVRIRPGKAIGDHLHETQLETHEVVEGEGTCRSAGREMAYRPGTISLLPAGVGHEVNAGEEGLLLFAKFMPPLC